MHHIWSLSHSPKGVHEATSEDEQTSNSSTIAGKGKKRKRNTPAKFKSPMQQLNKSIRSAKGVQPREPKMKKVNCNVEIDFSFINITSSHFTSFHLR